MIWSQLHLHATHVLFCLPLVSGFLLVKSLAHFLNATQYLMRRDSRIDLIATRGTRVNVNLDLCISISDDNNECFDIVFQRC